MASTDLLSPKCSICQSSTPKYRCPRCKAQTCSLPCVRTHKSRTLCTGIRDQATYLSKRQLSTPAAFDSDFNLLAGIERGVERAGRVFGESDDKAGRKGQEALRKAIVDAGVNVIRAPRGVKRERENGTSFDRRKRYISWTLEFKFLSRSVVTSASEMSTLVEAHDRAILDAWRGETDRDRRERVAEYARRAGVVVPVQYKGRQGVMSEIGLRERGNGDDRKQKAEVDAEDETTVSNPTTETTSEANQPESHLSAVSTIEEIPTVETTTAASQGDIHPTTTPITNSEQPPPAGLRRFYIHRPDQSTAQKQTLTPINGSSTIRSILSGKTVREFPTFHVDLPEFDVVDIEQWSVTAEI